MKKFLLLAMATLLAFPLSAFAASSEEAMMAELQKQIAELSEELEELSDRLDGPVDRLGGRDRPGDPGPRPGDQDAGGEQAEQHQQVENPLGRHGGDAG